MTYDTTTECALHEMIGCTICSGRAAAERDAEQAQHSDSRPFVARFAGHCPGCDLPINPGRDRIILRERSWGNVAIHEACA